MKKYNFNNLERISKIKAEKLYNSGLTVLFIPCKCNPENNFYNLGIWENKYLQGQFETFQELLNNYEFYNCNYNELGLYTAFYIKKEWYHIEFENGSNPYICKNINELERLLKKYGSNLIHIENNYFKVRKDVQ